MRTSKWQDAQDPALALTARPTQPVVDCADNCRLRGERGDPLSSLRRVHEAASHRQGEGQLEPAAGD